MPSANDDLVFRGTGLTQTENDLAAGTAFRSLWFLSNDFSITGNSLGVTSRIAVSPGASGTAIATGVVLDGAVKVTVIGGSLSLSGGVSGSGSLTENGNGVLILGASDTYAGNTTIQYGATLQLGCANAIPSGPVAGAVKVNGTLDLGGHNATVNGLSGSGLVTSTAPGAVTLTVDTTQSSTFSGVIEDGLGTMGLNTTGTGTLTLTGESTFGGCTTVGAGSTLRLGSANALPSDPEINGTLDLAGNNTNLDGLWGSGTVTPSVSGAVTLTVDTSNYSGTFSGVIENGSGTMAFATTGTGTQTLTGSNTYSGGTTLNSGTLSFANGSLASSGTISFAGNSTLRWNGYNTEDISSRLAISNGVTATLDVGSNTVTLATGFGGSGSGALTKAGSGTLIFAGANTYTGTTTISAGTLQVDDYYGGSLGSGAVVDNASLVFSPYSSLTVANAISGTGTLTLANGSYGTLILTGSNTYSGATTISGGTLQVGYGGTSGTLGSGAVTNNAALVFDPGRLRHDG